MGLLDHFRRTCTYEAWANARVNESLASAKMALESGPGGAAAEAPALIKAVQIWSHVQVARRLWLSRLGRGEPPSLDQGLFPVWPMRRAVDESVALDAAWAKVIDSMTESDLDAVARYTTTEGSPASSSVIDILTHVVNHSSYHRGQIARLVAECGGTPAATDFIFFARANPPTGVERS